MSVDRPVSQDAARKQFQDVSFGCVCTSFDLFQDMLSKDRDFSSLTILSGQQRWPQEKLRSCSVVRRCTSLRMPDGLPDAGAGKPSSIQVLLETQLLYRFMSCGVRLGSRSYHIVPVPEDRIKMVNASLNTALKAVIMIVYD